EVFLALVPQDGKTPAKLPRNFRWVLGEYLDLPFHEFEMESGKTERRRLQPDAMLEIPSLRRRIFIDFETGSATVKDTKKSTSTLAKLQRYETFLTERPGLLRGDERTTFYSNAFPDGWSAEVMFVATSVARRDSIKIAIADGENIRVRRAAR